MANVRALRPAVTGLCASCARQHKRSFTSAISRQFEEARESRVPRIAQPGLWNTVIPKAWRRPTSPEEAAERAARQAARKENQNTFWTSPYTPFLLLALLVGSNAIQIISERREMVNFSRKTEAKLETLREVVEKVRKGELTDPVEIKKALGTGVPREEEEWEEVMKEIENSEPLWEGKLRREEKHREKEEAARRKAQERREENLRRKEAKMRQGGGSEDGQQNGEGGENNSPRRPKFLM
jgi:hypothetical protein